VTLPPYDRPVETFSVSQAPSRRRSRRNLVIGATVTGAVVLGGVGFAAASYLSGGGAQPQDVLPADTLGFVSLDMDPAAGQKLGLLSLMDKFPDVTTEGDADFRGELLDPLLDEIAGGLYYPADVRPWLGDRMAVAAVPAEDSEVGVAPVLVLAVDDEDLMTENLDDAQVQVEFGYAMRDGFVVLTDSQERADDLVAAERTLADDGDYAGDRKALGGDQIALAWADMSALEQIAAATTPAPPESFSGGLFGGGQPSGRVIAGVHVADDALEMVGLAFSVSDVPVPDGEPTRLVQDLPEDTVVAFGMSELGDYTVKAWDQLEKAGDMAEIEQVEAELGIELPDDLRAIFGTDLAVALFGDLQQPEVGARVATDDPDKASRVLESVLSDPQFDVPAVYSDVDGGYVVAGEQETLDALSAGGALGATPKFRDAVADADDAGLIGYLDLEAVVQQVIDQGGEDGDEAAKFTAAKALGFSMTTTDEGVRFVVRLTVR
jgi:hypothetical protein